MLYVTTEETTAELQHSKSPEAVYSQLNVTEGGDAPKMPLPVAIPLPPRGPASKDSFLHSCYTAK